MRKHLEQLANAKTCSLELLQKAHVDWLGSTLQHRDDFIQSRKALVKKFGGCFLEGSDALKMKTSGTSCGIAKTYYWGPSWMSHHNFFEWVKFQPYQFDLLLYISPHPTIKSIKVDALPIIPGMSHILYMNPNQPSHAQDIKKFIGNKRIILWLMPSYAKLLIDREFDFTLFPPDTTYIYATGECSSKELSGYFIDRGYRYIDAMRSWMGGATFITCEYGNTHWLKMLADVSHGKGNELITTDLFNLAQPFINFETTDYATWIEGKQCACGLEINDIEFIDRDIKLPMANQNVPFDAISLALISVMKDSKKDNLLFCSFGYHEKSNSLFVLYETMKNTHPISANALKEFVEKLKINVAVVYAVNRYKANQYKIAKIFNVTDEECLELKRIAHVKV